MRTEGAQGSRIHGRGWEALASVGHSKQLGADIAPGSGEGMVGKWGGEKGASNHVGVSDLDLSTVGNAGLCSGQ